MALIAKFLLLFMINIILGDPLLLQVNQRVDANNCGCNSCCGNGCCEPEPKECGVDAWCGPKEVLPTGEAVCEDGLVHQPEGDINCQGVTGKPLCCSDSEPPTTTVPTTIITTTAAPTPPPCTDCCDFNGIEYENGARLPDVCTALVCDNGNWTYEGGVHTGCGRCDVYNDPHFTTFDGTHFNWHGKCSYSITQDGVSFVPSFAVYGEFSECVPPYQTATCLKVVTFINDASSVITFENNPGFSYTFNVLLNGIDLTLTSTPQLFGDSFFAWRGYFQPLADQGAAADTVTVTEDDCVIILGSQGLMIQYCGWNMYVWAYTDSLEGSLYGLCGYYDGDASTDFTDRDGTVSGLVPFAQSWEDSTCPSTRSLGSPESNCEDTSAFRDICEENVQGIDMPDNERTLNIDNCAYDICVVTESNSTDIGPEKWLDKIKASAVLSEDIRKSAVDITDTSTEGFVGDDRFVVYGEKRNWAGAQALCRSHGRDMYVPINITAVAEYLNVNFDAYYWLGAQGNGTHMVWVSGGVLHEDDPWRNSGEYTEVSTDKCLDFKTGGMTSEAGPLVASGCNTLSYVLCGVEENAQTRKWKTKYGGKRGGGKHGKVPKNPMKGIKKMALKPEE